jgi:purine-nucleoside phosphorylase
MDMEALEYASQCVFERLETTRASCVLILGSGWSDVANAFDLISEIPYINIPGMGAPGVAGHAGCLRHCRSGSEDILIFQGRRHWYEGHGWTPVAIPVYIARQAKARAVFLTNAAGGITEDMTPGDLMMITDHINAMGDNPLIGPHDATWGQRFPDQSAIYHETLRGDLISAAGATGAELKEGVYLATSGPTYETPAEIRSYRALGADAVGMSTVPEAILANAAGIKVAGISCITNFAAGVSPEPLGHDEVLETTERVMPTMTAIIREFVTHVCSEPA